MTKLQQAQISLLEWYESNGRRELPWRNTTNIYHIYLSEIMLQQTQVSRVQEEYYPKFLAKFPTIASLADAPLDEVLASWSGLGYYNRARNLHKCAQNARDGLPQEFNALCKLSGIGKYTASAICSFGYEQNISVVDTNISRVIKRFFGLKEPKESEIWQRADTLLNRSNPKSHNLALMDLGSLVCLPANPQCNKCPLTDHCHGKENPKLYTITKKIQYESLELFYGIWTKENQIALTPSTGTMYKDMLELPSVEPIDADFITTFKHSYTKYRITVNLYKVESVAHEALWIDLDDIHNAPISSLTKKALRSLKNINITF